MPTNTPNHGYQLFGQHETGWEHRTDFQKLDTDVEIRDTDANKANYTPKAGAKFKATDTGAEYRGTGTGWVAIEHSNNAHSLAFVSDGDGVERQIWVSADGTVPAGADPDDIVLTQV